MRTKAPSVASGGPILVVHPSPDLYGADLQMLETVAGLVDSGSRVFVALPSDGPLVPRIRDVGGEVLFLRFPVLRKGSASVRGLATLAIDALVSIVRGVRLIRKLQARVLFVNTVTLPWWLLTGRLARTTVVAHIHEAETQGRRIVRKALVAQLWLADIVIVISRSTLDAMADVQPRLRSRARLIYNGVPQPAAALAPPRRTAPVRLAVIGRLSPRKAPHVAIEAVARLRSQGYDAVLEVVGTTFAGYEWYEDELRERADKPDLTGAIQFSGYCSPIWGVLERTDIVVAPSLNEPFGNAVVEAQLAGRPVVAAANQGHLETVLDEVTGLLTPPGDAVALASAVARLIDDDELAARVGETGRSEAIRRFSVERYRREVAAAVEAAVR